MGGIGRKHGSPSRQASEGPHVQIMRSGSFQARRGRGGEIDRVGGWLARIGFDGSTAGEVAEFNSIDEMHAINITRAELYDGRN